MRAGETALHHATGGWSGTPHDRLGGLLDELGLDVPRGRARITGTDPVLPSRYPLGEAAAAVLAALGLTLADLTARRGGPAQVVTVDVRHAGAALRGFLDQLLDGEVLDPDPTGRLPAVGLHRAADGRWVQVYGAFAPLLERTLGVLGCAEDRASVAAAIARREAGPLVEALVAAGAPAAVVGDGAAWAAHPQGRALCALPPVVLEPLDAAPARLAGAGPRPLEGVRVVDLSRIVAGPVCGRTLAEHGAAVVQVVDPRLHTVQRAQLDTAPGKRVVTLSLADATGRARLLALVDAADVVIQNASPGSFERRGLGAVALAARRPGLVYVSIDAYGHVGPWATRRGFEPLAQASTGWMTDHAGHDGVPQLVPGLPCDHVTGYLAALGAVAALRRREHEGGAWHVRASLARTAMWLRDQPGRQEPAAAPPLGARDTDDLRVPLATASGILRPLRPAIGLSHTPARWGEEI